MSGIARTGAPRPTHRALLEASRWRCSGVSRCGRQAMSVEKEHSRIRGSNVLH
jgi:hypothetical protein